MNPDSYFTKKYYIVGLIDYVLAVAAFWEGLDVVLRIVAAVGVIVSTWYLIKKYESESKLNKQKLERERMETQIKEQELASIILKNKSPQRTTEG